MNTSSQSTNITPQTPAQVSGDEGMDWRVIIGPATFELFHKLVMYNIFNSGFEKRAKSKNTRAHTVWF